MIKNKPLNIKPDFNHIPILDDVIFTFHAQTSFGTGLGRAAEGNHVFKGDNLGADEAFFHV